VDEFFQVRLQQETSLLVPLANTVEVIVINRQEICQIPGVLPNLFGTIARRGQLLWILDLSELLGLTPTKSTRAQSSEKLFILVLTTESVKLFSFRDELPSQIGCVVQKLQGIISIETPTYAPVTSQFQERVHSFLLGMTEIADSQIAVLDVQKLLAFLRTY
jgi:chemotaxis signal transduction protein